MMYKIAYLLESIVALMAIAILIKGLAKEKGLLVIYVLFSTLADIFSKFAIITLPGGMRSNHYYFNLEFIIEICLLILAFSYWLKKENPIKKLSFWILGIWIAVSVLNLLWLQGFYILNTFSFLIGYLISVIFSLAYLFLKFNNPGTKSLLKDPETHIWIGIFISASASFTYRAFEPILNYSNHSLFINIIISSAITKYLFIGFGFFKAINQRQ